MSDPSPSPPRGAQLWPENNQMVCVLDSRDVAHRSFKCPGFHETTPSGWTVDLRFTTTGLAMKAGKTPCFCLEELP